MHVHANIYISTHSYIPPAYTRHCPQAGPQLGESRRGQGHSNDQRVVQFRYTVLLMISHWLTIYSIKNCLIKDACFRLHKTCSSSLQPVKLVCFLLIACFLTNHAYCHVIYGFVKSAVLEIVSDNTELLSGVQSEHFLHLSCQTIK